jgi:radical SAM protein with 4Fe4S-binding SPASM domain
MSLTLWQQLINQLVALDDQTFAEFQGLSLGLFGDPLLDKGLFDKAQYYNTQMPKGQRRISFSLTTNAAQLQFPILTPLTECFDGINIHFESIIPAYYQQLMPGLDYDKVIKQIHQLLEFKQTKNKHFHVLIATPISKYNHIERSVYNHYWLEAGADAVFFENLCNRAGSLTTFEQSIVPDSDIVTTQCLGDTTQHLIIDWDGTVLLCCQDFQRQVKIGHFPTQSITELLVAERRLQLKHQLDHQQHHTIVTCAACRNNPVN